MKRLISMVALLILVAAFVTTGCRRSAEPASPVRIGHLAIANSLPLYVAIEKGLFKSQGVEAELVEFQTSNDLRQPLGTHLYI